VVGGGIIRIDLSESRKPLCDLFGRQNANVECPLTLDIVVERDLRAGQQADRDIRLPDRGEPTSEGIGEPGRH